MTPERQELAFEMFDAAIARPEAERERFVALKCADDQELGAEVRSLLAAHGDASGFLSRRAQSSSRPALQGRAPASPVLQTGDRLGAFLIENFVGAGGMGEVYRARDTRLDRHVAIKVLLADSAADPRRRARFMSEARAIARISHPHICALHDIGQHDDIDFLVMEYLEGESLADRLRKGRLPLAEALRIALEIGRALAAAHARGIVHRDLKPGNVMLTKSGAKLLDFGLARLRPPTTADGSMMGAAAQSSHTPGLIVGTVHYMSPEQLEGKEVDGRTDIFAFGAVVYEMVVGRRAFQGETAASVMSSIISAHPPPISDLEPLAPPALDRLVRKCLDKDPDERWSSMHDALAVLEWIREAPHVEREQPALVRGARKRVLAPAIAAAAVVATAIAAWVPWTGPSWPLTARFDITLPQHVSFDSWLDAPILSPDGRYVALVASDDGVRRLMVRRLDDQHVTAVAGTEGVYGNPFWSSDGRYVAFFAGRQLKRVAVTGGPVVSVCACEAAYGWDGSWSQAGVLLFADRAGIRSVREDGTGLQSVTRLAEGDFAHLSPAFLPDGRHVLYRVAGARPGIYVASIDGGAATRIVEEGSRAQYVADGYVLFTRRETLFAQSFDLRARQLRGEPLTVAENVLGFSASDNGVVVYRPATMQLSRLVWFARDGRRLSVVSDSGRHVSISLSPSGRKVAIQRRDEGSNDDLWLLDQTTAIISQLTSDPADDADPVWSPDERRLVFTSNRQGRYNLFQKDLINGREEPLLADPPAPGASVDDWSVDGRHVIFRRGFGEAIYSLPMEGDPKPQLIAEMPANSDESHLSPDGKWLAFQTNETGRWEIHVAAFPGFTEKRQVSTNGGMEPIWRRDGRELFYRDLDGRLMAVPVSTEPAFDPGTPEPLFRTGMRPNLQSQYAAARDGQSFLLLDPDRSGGESLTFVLDWRARLQSK